MNVSKYVAAALVAVVTALPGLAEPVGLKQVMSELGKRGASQLEGVLLSGTPVVSGAFGEQGFNASMYQCDQPENVCRVLVFRTCRHVSGLTDLDGLLLANRYNNAEEPRGLMMVPEAGEASSACVVQRFDLEGGNRFDQWETFLWSRTVETFLEFVGDYEREKLSQSILQ